MPQIDDPRKKPFTEYTSHAETALECVAKLIAAVEKTKDSEQGGGK